MDKLYNRKSKQNSYTKKNSKEFYEKMIKGYKEMATISIEICEYDSEIVLETLENYEDYLSECDKK